MKILLRAHLKIQDQQILYLKHEKLPSQSLICMDYLIWTIYRLILMLRTLFAVPYHKNKKIDLNAPLMHWSDSPI